MRSLEKPEGITGADSVMGRVSLAFSGAMPVYTS